MRTLARGRALTLAVALFAVFALAAGCGGSSGGSSTGTTTAGGTPSPTGTTAAATIVMNNFAFMPATLTVAPGTKVTVENKDSAPHTVTANDKSFDTGTVDPGKTTTFTAPNKPGSYAYICTIHPYMKGTLVVKG